MNMNMNGIHVKIIVSQVFYTFQNKWFYLILLHLINAVEFDVLFTVFIKFGTQNHVLLR